VVVSASINTEDVIVEIMGASGRWRLLDREAINVHVIAAWVVISLSSTLLGI
jgi:hypothetical protein